MLLHLRKVNLAIPHVLVGLELDLLEIGHDGSYTQATQHSLADTPGDVGLLVEGIDDFREGLDAFFAGDLTGCQFQCLHRGELFRFGQP